MSNSSTRRLGKRGPQQQTVASQPDDEESLGAVYDDVNSTNKKRKQIQGKIRKGSKIVLENSTVINLPDSALHGGCSQRHQQTDDSSLVPVSAPVNNLAAPPPGYPYNNNYCHNSPQSSETATAYPYAQQPDYEELSGASFEVISGNNTNKKGQQHGGNIRLGNTRPGSAPFAIPQHGRFVFNAGNNVNEGDSQVSGNIDFANVEHE